MSGEQPREIFTEATQDGTGIIVNIPLEYFIAPEDQLSSNEEMLTEVLRRSAMEQSAGATPSTDLGHRLQELLTDLENRWGFSSAMNRTTAQPSQRIDEILARMQNTTEHIGDFLMGPNGEFMPAEAPVQASRDDVERVTLTLPQMLAYMERGNWFDGSNEDADLEFAMEESRRAYQLERKPVSLRLPEEPRPAELGDDCSCAVCLDEIASGDPSILLQCRHIFHPMCIREWVCHKPCCPVCRSSIVVDAVESVD
jgi:hypothetical protein